MDLLEKYKAYYAVRAKRYAGNSNYKHTFEAEQRLSEAMQSCSSLEEFRERIGNLNEQCALALIKDQYLMELAHFQKHHENIRVKEAERVLAETDSCNGVQDAMKLVGRISSEVSTMISMDESHADTFLGNLHVMEHYLIFSNAEVPDQYKHLVQENAEQKRNALIETMVNAENNNNAWQQHWTLHPDVCFEQRHFRHCPISAEHLHELRLLYKTLVNR